MNTFTAPQIDYVAISPILIVGIGALLSVLAGHKTWFIRDPTHKLPGWLDRTWESAAGQSTEAWLRAAMAASDQI